MERARDWEKYIQKWESGWENKGDLVKNTVIEVGKENSFQSNFIMQQSEMPT